MVFVREQGFVVVAALRVHCGALEALKAELLMFKHWQSQVHDGFV